MNYAIFQGIKQGSPITLSVNQHGKSMDRLAREIMALLDQKEWHPNLTLEHPNKDPSGYHIWAAPVARAMPELLWTPATACKSKHITYQFDGVSSAHLTNPDAEMAASLLKVFTSRGYGAIRLGSHLSLHQCMELTSTALCHVGADSGMSHLAHATATPCYIFELHLPIITTHRGKQYVTIRSALELEAVAHHILDMYA
jgi:hypothetical protein